jgi:hypothetical protein
MKIHTIPNRLVVEIEEESFRERGFSNEKVLEEIKYRCDNSPELEIEKVTLVFRNALKLNCDATRTVLKD